MSDQTFVLFKSFHVQEVHKKALGSGVVPHKDAAVTLVTCYDSDLEEMMPPGCGIAGSHQVSADAFVRPVGDVTIVIDNALSVKDVARVMIKCFVAEGPKPWIVHFDHHNQPVRLC